MSTHEDALHVHGLIYGSLHYEPLMFPPPVLKPEPYNAAMLRNRMHCFDASSYYSRLGEIRDQIGPMLWKSVYAIIGEPESDPQYPPGQMPSAPPPDNYVTAVSKAGYRDAPVHQNLFCAVCTKSNYLSYPINAMSPPSGNHFKHLHRYIYLRDVESIFLYLTGVSSVSREEVAFPKNVKWSSYVRVLQNESEKIHKYVGVVIIGFYMMIDALGIYDDLLWQTVNLSWWFLNQALSRHSNLHRLSLDDWKSETNRVWQDITVENVWNDGQLSSMHDLLNNLPLMPHKYIVSDVDKGQTQYIVRMGPGYQ